MEKTKKKLSLTSKIAIGFALGIILGLIFGEKIMVIKVIGDIFMKLLKMLVMPLVLLSLISGVSSISDIRKLRSIGTKTLAIFLVNTLLACVAGLALGAVFKPGAGVIIDSASTDIYQATAIPSWSDTLLSLFPDNVFNSLSSGNMIQVIVFALFFAIAIAALGEKAEGVRKGINSLADVMYKVTNYVLALSPVGVCALIACSVGQYGLGVFGALGKLIVADYAIQLIFCIVIYFPMIRLISNIKVGYFMRKILPVWAMTASTTSSAGTLPVTLKVATDDLGIDEEVANFVCPLGSTVNMAGGAIWDAVVVIFAAQIYGIDLTFTQMVLVVVTASLICIGSPGIPGGGVVSAVMLIGMLGIPIEVAGMIAAIYRLLDMAHTTMNVTGDIVTAAVVAKTENLLHTPEEGICKAAK